MNEIIIFVLGFGLGIIFLMAVRWLIQWYLYTPYGGWGDDED